MNQSSIANILDLAIGKELAAVKFYHKLMQQATSFEQMEAIRSIELMERKHAETLQQLKESNAIQKEAFQPSDLSLLDDQPEDDHQLPADFTALLLLAIKREELAYQLYQQLAQNSDDLHLKQLFQKLAHEELKHKHHFEQLYQQKSHIS